MKKHIVYIQSDANRVYIEAGYTQDLALTLFELNSPTTTYKHNGPTFSRIVHMEEFENYELALKRKIELANYTRMQKDRLIRKNNPNWLNIRPLTIVQTKKAVVYA